MDASTRRLLDKPWFLEGLAELQEELGVSQDALREQAEEALGEMWTTHDPVASDLWRRFGALLTQRYELDVDEAQLARIAELDRAHPLVFLFSHRSYLDIWLLRETIERAGVGEALGLAGANLDFFPMGPILRRTGALFIRRTTKGAPVYRYVLRSYIAHILEDRRNLGWSIEGGRTRTGKLRPPRYGALRYVVDAERRRTGPETLLLPVSVVYDQLGEVAQMTAEALGESKRPEDIGWLLRFALMQRNQGGLAHVDIGEPIPLRERIEAIEEDPNARDTVVERIAVGVCHNINRVTPATPTAVVTLALLAAERALTLEETVEVLEPILRYLATHPHLPWTMGGDLRDRGWVEDTLQRLTASGVVERFDGGIETVYLIKPKQHLVAAFYRNTLIHFFVVRAIGELAMVLEREQIGDLREAIWHRALSLRELLKFEFFFADRREFQEQLLAELLIVDPSWDASVDADGRYTRVITRDMVERWFTLAQPHLAHLVLRPFLDAYHLFAEELARWSVDQDVDEGALLERCLGVGRQRVLQGRLHSAESVTLELFKNALRLAHHRHLVEGRGEALRAQRVAFAQQLAHLVEELGHLASGGAAT
jgi:glycerol-3-phosphate O-acyltransferase